MGDPGTRIKGVRPMADKRSILIVHDYYGKQLCRIPCEWGYGHIYVSYTMDDVVTRKYVEEYVQSELAKLEDERVWVMPLTIGFPTGTAGAADNLNPNGGCIPVWRLPDTGSPAVRATCPMPIQQFPQLREREANIELTFVTFSTALPTPAGTVVYQVMAFVYRGDNYDAKPVLNATVNLALPRENYITQTLLLPKAVQVRAGDLLSIVITRLAGNIQDNYNGPHFISQGKVVLNDKPPPQPPYTHEYKWTELPLEQTPPVE